MATNNGVTYPNQFPPTNNQGGESNFNSMATNSYAHQAGGFQGHPNPAALQSSNHVYPAQNPQGQAPYGYPLPVGGKQQASNFISQQYQAGGFQNQPHSFDTVVHPGQIYKGQAIIYDHSLPNNGGQQYQTGGFENQPHSFNTFVYPGQTYKGQAIYDYSLPNNGGQQYQTGGFQNQPNDFASNFVRPGQNLQSQFQTPSIPVESQYPQAANATTIATRGPNFIRGQLVTKQAPVLANLPSKQNISEINNDPKKSHKPFEPPKDASIQESASRQDLGDIHDRILRGNLQSMRIIFAAAKERFTSSKGVDISSKMHVSTMVMAKDLADDIQAFINECSTT